MPATPKPYSVRVVAQHPDLQPWIFWLKDASDNPWRRLAGLRKHVPSAPNTSWPTEGWTLQMDYQCPHCGETRLVTLEQTYRGQELCCAVCGKVAPYVRAAGTRASSSPTLKPTLAAPAVERP